MNKTLLATLLILLSIPFATAATPDNTEDNTSGNFSFEIYGFVRNDITVDSRKCLASVSELFCFIPYDNDYNHLGQDLNAIPSSRFVSVTSRFGFNATSPLYGGKLRLSAKIETDFCGQSNYIQLLRIRQAHFALRWPHHQIIVGQAWHPMSADLLPSIVSLNTGAPFNPFSRAPQMRYNAFAGPITFSAAAIYQFQYTSPGPEGNSAKYQVFGGLPEFYAGITATGKQWKVGIGAEYMQLKPATVVDEVKINSTVRSFASQLFAEYHTDHFSLRAKSVYGQNLAHLLMMSGYGTYSATLPLDPPADPTDIRYSPLAQSSTWASVAYHTTNPIHNIRATLFGGYMKNLGAAHTITGEAYLRGFDNIDQMFRIAPSIQYCYRDLHIGLEYEYTGVVYGNTLPDYSVAPTHLVGNHRAYINCIYHFNHIFSSAKKKK